MHRWCQRAFGDLEKHWTRRSQRWAPFFSGESLVLEGTRTLFVYSRIATMAARTGQALLQHPAAGGIGHGRFQLYVDDPALVVEGTLSEQKATIDRLITWFLVLGIPLSWKKGYFLPAEQPHTWIGVSFVVKEPGIATLQSF